MDIEDVKPEGSFKHKELFLAKMRSILSEKYIEFLNENGGEYLEIVLAAGPMSLDEFKDNLLVKETMTVGALSTMFYMLQSNGK